MGNIFTEIITPANDKAGKRYYFIPLISIVLFILFSIGSLFTIRISDIGNGFVLLSIASRILFSLGGAYIIKRLFYLKNGNRQFHTILRHFTGYFIVFTYVSYGVPQVVSDFNAVDGSGYSPFFIIIVSLCTLFPTIFYFLLKRESVIIALGTFTKKELKLYKVLKKDKKKRNKARKEMKAERSAMQNLWFEWVEPIFGAIIWVIVINHFFIQLYQIPSSSMVPTFLEKDRVFVTKSFSGPSIPLTKWHLPALNKPKTGDIVTFQNPAVDDPNSELSYDSVFKRLFHPFILRLTFTLWDIDKTKLNGQPKARDLVKRVIGEPGEKICIVNGSVYKKTEDTQWRRMSDIPGSKEYGRSDLFLKNNPNAGIHFMNPSLHEKLDSAFDSIAIRTSDSIEESLIADKENLVELIDSIEPGKFISEISKYINSDEIKKNIDIIERNTEFYYGKMLTINNPNNLNRDKNEFISNFDFSLNQYVNITFYELLNELYFLLREEINNPGYINHLILTDLNIDSDTDPYNEFMIKLNGIYKEYKIKMFSSLIRLFQESDESGIAWDLILDEKSEEYNFIEILSNINIYTDGLYSIFDRFNYPPYPEEEGVYLGDTQYFLMGDNRYNSHDSRFDKPQDEFKFADDSDQSSFGKTIKVKWDARPIDKRYIHGRARAILFPLSRFKIFF